MSDFEMPNHELMHMIGHGDHGSHGSVHSNNDVNKLGLYAGIVGSGAALGFAYAVEDDPIYNKGKTPKRMQTKMTDAVKPIVLNIHADPIDAAMHEMHTDAGQVGYAAPYDRQAKEIWENLSEDQRKAYAKMTEPEPQPKPRAKWRRELSKTVRKMRNVRL